MEQGQANEPIKRRGLRTFRRPKVRCSGLRAFTQLALLLVTLVWLLVHPWSSGRKAEPMLAREF